MLLEAFRQLVPDFEILGAPYLTKTEHPSGNNRYILYRNDPDTLDNVIMQDMVMSPFYTADGLHYTSSAIAAYTGVNIYRPLEVIYYDTMQDAGQSAGMSSSENDPIQTEASDYSKDIAELKGVVDTIKDQNVQLVKALSNKDDNKKINNNPSK